MNDRSKECINEIFRFYDEKDFINLANAYDEFLTWNGLKYTAFNTIFSQVQKNNTIEIPTRVLKAWEYDGEPVILVLNEDIIAFYTMYKGATIDDVQLPDDIGTIIDMYDLPEDRKIVLNDACMKALGLQEGDIILMEYSEESLHNSPKRIFQNIYKRKCE